MSKFATLIRTALVCLPLALQTAPALAESGTAMVLPVDPKPLTVETTKGNVSFEIEVADDENEREAGLMFRNYLPADHGMLFVFDKQQDIGFWMKNTVLPLDLIFIDQNGRIQDIAQGEPLSEATISPDGPVQYVLELNKGAAAKAGIADGDMVLHPRIGDETKPTN